jgi:hypothetical protein
MDEERDDGANEVRGTSQAEKNEKIDGIRKHSFTEKITGVKNSKAEHLLKQTNSNINREQARQMRIIQDNKSILRHEYKLMQFDKKKNTLEVKKRCNPHYDFSLEEAGVAKSEQYLKEPVEGWYLQKCNAIRRRSVGDATQVTPAVAKARETLRQSELMKQFEQYRMDMASFPPDMVPFPPNPGSNENTQSPGKIPHSKSVSLDSLSLVSSANSSGRHQDQMFRKESPNMLPRTPCNPTIDIVITDLETNQGQEIVTNGKPIVKVSGSKFYGDTKDNKTVLQSILHGEKNCSSKGAVRFSNSAKVTAQKILGETPMLQTSVGKPHVSFQVRSQARKNSIGQVRPHSEMQARRPSTATGSTSASTRRPGTHEMLERESTDIKERMNKFFKRLEVTKAGSSRNDDVDELNSLRISPHPNKYPEKTEFYPIPEVHPPSKLQSTTVDMSAFTSTTNEDLKPAPKGERIFAIIVDDKSAEETPAQGQQRRLSVGSKWKFMANKVTEDLPNAPHSLPMKESPDHTRRSSVVSMTGSDISINSGAGGRRRSSVGIPSHSMERSNRHSATFKLRKLVNELMKQKTRYELNELEELKRNQSEALENQNMRSRTGSINSESPKE